MTTRTPNTTSPATAGGSSGWARGHRAGHLVQDVVAALTIAYDILVGGLLVAILGGLMWKRGTGMGAAVSMAVGTVVTLATMIVLEINAGDPYDGVYANEPIYYGLAASLVMATSRSRWPPGPPIARSGRLGTAAWPASRGPGGRLWRGPKRSSPVGEQLGALIAWSR